MRTLSSQRPLRVLALTQTPPAEGCTWARILTPLEHLAAEGRVEFNHNYKSVSPWWIKNPSAMLQLLQDLPNWDVVWISRPFFYITLPFIREARQHAKPILADLDDWLLDVPIGHGKAAAIRHPALQRTLRTALRAVDAITVSTQMIADRCDAMGLRAHVLPNALDCSPFTREPRDDKVITIAFCGTKTHANDILLAAPVLRKMLLYYGERIRVVSLGCPIQGLHGVEGYTHYDQVAASDYARFISGLHIDIGLAPLEDSPFNRAKSDIKYLEYSAVGAATIASPIPPYAGSIQEDRGMLVGANTEDAWMTGIRQLVDDTELRQQVSANAYNWVRRERSIEEAASSWYNLFRDYADGRIARGAPAEVQMSAGYFERAMANSIVGELSFFKQAIRNDILDKTRSSVGQWLA